MSIRVLVASLAVVTVLSGCASMGGEAQQQQAQRMSSMEQKIADIERRLDNMSSVAMLEQVEALRAQVRQLRGELEEQQYKQTNAEQRQRQQFLDLDNRLRSLEGGQAAVATPPSRDQNQGESAAYQKAFTHLKNARYTDAARDFKQFLQDYPESQFADNAQYWLSESHYVSREFEQAKVEFAKVITQYPGSAKVADAELKLGFIAYEQRQWSEARQQLNRVSAQYPDTTASQLAIQRLSRMDQEGR